MNRLPDDPKERKNIPLAAVLDYFPDALAEIAKVIKAGNDQHNPGQPIHWARDKSQDHDSCLIRHFVDRGSEDTDGLRHSAKLAWRALALLQIELEKEHSLPVSRGSREPVRNEPVQLEFDFNRQKPPMSIAEAMSKFPASNDEGLDLRSKINGLP